MKTFRKILLWSAALVAVFVAYAYFEWPSEGVAIVYLVIAIFYLGIKIGDLEKEVEYLKYRLDNQD